MSGNVVVAGPLIVDEVLDDRGETRVALGGVAYALAGALTWAPECRLVANAGQDLERWHGPWLEANGVEMSGVRRCLPATKRSRLRYVESGLFVEESVHDAAVRTRLRELDRRTAEHIRSRVDERTLGVYLEASVADPIWESPAIYDLADRVPVMWEVETGSAITQAWRTRTLEVSRRLGLFSVNLPEALALFDVRSRAEAEAAIVAHGADCYLRLGAAGSAFISDGEVRFAPSVEVAEVVDATGCGNASTAGALAAIGLGVAPGAVAEMGNRAAAAVLGSYGPPKLVERLGS